MTIYLVIPLLAIVGLLQATFVSRVAIWGVFPDLPLLIVVSWGLLRGSRQGLLWGFVAGIIVDLFSGAPFGAATVPLMVVGFMAGLGETVVFRNVFLLLLAMFLATVVYDLLFLFMVQISGDLLQETGRRVEWSGEFGPRYRAVCDSERTPVPGDIGWNAPSWIDGSGAKRRNGGIVT